MAQHRDNLVIEGGQIEQQAEYRRRRSLKFRAKMRAHRAKLFSDPFHKKDRSCKNEKKIEAAKRRRRNSLGKFNFEGESASGAVSYTIGGSEPVRKPNCCKQLNHPCFTVSKIVVSEPADQYSPMRSEEDQTQRFVLTPLKQRQNTTNFFSWVDLVK